MTAVSQQSIVSVNPTQGFPLTFIKFFGFHSPAFQNPTYSQQSHRRRLRNGLLNHKTIDNRIVIPVSFHAHQAMNGKINLGRICCPGANHQRGTNSIDAGIGTFRAMLKAECRITCGCYGLPSLNRCFGAVPPVVSIIADKLDSVRMTDGQVVDPKHQGSTVNDIVGQFLDIHSRSAISGC